MNYLNNNRYNTNFNKLCSSLPYDIKAKNENSLIYDYGNDELNEKFSIIYDLNNPEKQIKIIEGVNWSNWKSPDDTSILSSLSTYYSRAITIFNNNLQNPIFDLPNFNSHFIIINKSLNRYKKCMDNGNIYMMEIDVIIHRENRPLARHLKMIVVCSPLKTSFIFCKVIGVIKEGDIHKNTIKPASLSDNYVEFYPERPVIYDTNSFIYDMDDRRANSQVSYNLYNKLLKDLTS